MKGGVPVMETVFEEDRRFERDTKKLDRETIRRLESKINQLGTLQRYPKNHSAFRRVWRMRGLDVELLPRIGIENVGRRHFLIYSVTEDRINDEFVVSLHRFVSHDDLDRAARNALMQIELQLLAEGLIDYGTSQDETESESGGEG